MGGESGDLTWPGSVKEGFPEDMALELGAEGPEGVHWMQVGFVGRENTPILYFLYFI